MSDPSRRTLQPGDWVFREGDQADAAFIVQSGQVEIIGLRDGEERRLTVLHPGDLFGELALIDDGPRSASARAVGNTDLAVLPRSLIQDRIARADPTIRLLVHVIMVRLRRELSLVGSVPVIASPDAPEVPESALGDPSDHTKMVDRMILEGDMHNAIRDEEFQLHYQPIIRLSDQTIAGFEALVRWHHHSRGVVWPDVFIGIAEETRLINDLGRWIMHEAARGLRFLQDTLDAHHPNAPKLFMAINISSRQLEDGDLLNHMDAALAAADLVPNQIKLEITEGALVDSNRALRWIKDCHGRGYTVALDDFGTGYSSLSYLSNFDVDAIKIDRSFIMRMLEVDRSMVLVRAIVSLAAGLGVPAVAEGVETGEHVAALQDLNCMYGQGYHYARPGPREDVAALLERYVLGA